MESAHPPSNNTWVSRDKIGSNRIKSDRLWSTCNGKSQNLVKKVFKWRHWASRINATSCLRSSCSMLHITSHTGTALLALPFAPTNGLCVLSHFWYQRGNLSTITSAGMKRRGEGCAAGCESRRLWKRQSVEMAFLLGKRLSFTLL